MPTSKTTIFSAPQGWGKTSQAMKLLTEFGCTQLVEDWFPGEPIAPGALHLTHATPAEVETNLGNQARREVMIVGRGW